jgi:hypothetical protein
MRLCAFVFLASQARYIADLVSCESPAAWSLRVVLRSNPPRNIWLISIEAQSMCPQPPAPTNLQSLPQQ